MRTGFPQADARDDFERARRKARWVKLAGWLCARPSSRNRLLVLGEVTIVTGASRHGLASEAAVPIDHIVGSVEPTLCFDRHFRPTSQLPRTRFERIAADVRCGRGMHRNLAVRLEARIGRRAVNEACAHGRLAEDLTDRELAVLRALSGP